MASRGAETTFAAAEVFFACGAGAGRFLAGDEARAAPPVGVVRFAFGALEALEAVVGRELVGAGGGVVTGTGIGVAATAGFVGRVAGRVVFAVLDVFAALDFGAVLSVSGASGLGVTWARVASEGAGDERAGAFAIRGASAIRGGRLAPGADRRSVRHGGRRGGCRAREGSGKDGGARRDGNPPALLRSPQRRRPPGHPSLPLSLTHGTSYREVGQPRRDGAGASSRRRGARRPLPHFSARITPWSPKASAEPYCDDQEPWPPTCSPAEPRPDCVWFSVW